MDISTTFKTTTGTLWTVSGSLLTRVESDRDEGRDTYVAIPNAVGRSGQAQVAVRVGSTVAFLADGVVNTTGRVAEIVRVASVTRAA